MITDESKCRSQEFRIPINEDRTGRGRSLSVSNFHLSQKCHFPNSARQLIKDRDKYSRGNITLTIYVKECDKKILKMLHENGFLKELNLFHIVIQDNDVTRRDSKVAYLIQADVDVNEVWKKNSDEYSTPLQLSVGLSQFLTAQSLILARADVNAVGKYRNSRRRFRFSGKKKTALDLAAKDPAMSDFLKRCGGLGYRELRKTKKD